MAFKTSVFASILAWAVSSTVSAGAFAAELEYAVVGDGGRWNSSARMVRDSVRRSGITRLVLPGDNLYDGHDYAAPWDHWSKHGLTFDIVAIGNHTLGYRREIEFFGMPGEYYAKTPSPDVRFLVLNSDNTRTASEQARWLDEQLEAAKERLVFPVFHHPSLTLTSVHPWEERKAFHEAVRPLFFRHRSKITALLVGHDHAASLVAFDDLPVILSGAVQDQRKPEWRDDTQVGIRVRTQWLFERAPHWVALDLDTESGEATARFIRAKDDREICTARMRSGSAAELGENCKARAVVP